MNMNYHANSKTCRYMGVVFACACLFMAGSLPAQQNNAGVPGSVITPKMFSTPEVAARAIIDAAAAYDVDAIAEILGSEGKAIVFTDSPAEDRRVVSAFAELAREKNEVATDPNNENLAVLNIGNEDWPFAIPLVRKDGEWFFDAVRGKQEMVYRRIGANELDTIEICRGYVVAQQEYAADKHDGSLVNQYAQRIISTPGKQDGLAWENADGSWGGPIGEAAATAIAEGYTKADPYHGYYYKILTKQGPDAPLGSMDYVIQGAMIGGFALAAVPAEYGVTGVMTFIVSNDGVVYQKDLGPESLEEFRKLEVFNPDDTWTAVPVEAE
jgi:hypothetical protein